MIFNLDNFARSGICFSKKLSFIIFQKNLLSCKFLCKIGFWLADFCCRNKWGIKEIKSIKEKQTVIFNMHWSDSYFNWVFVDLIPGVFHGFRSWNGRGVDSFRWSHFYFNSFLTIANNLVKLWFSDAKCRIIAQN